MPIKLRSKSFEVSILQTSIWSGTSKFFDPRSTSSFDPLSLHIFCTPPVPIGAKITSMDEFIEELELVKELGFNFERTVEELVKKTALVHEGRHFHDLLCTPYGINTFLKNYEAFARKCLIEQLSLIKEIEEQDGVSQVFSNSDEPLLTSFLQEHALNQLNLTKDPILWREGHEKEVDYYEITLTDLPTPVKIPCIFTNVLQPDGEKRTAIWPVNFTLITECLATIEQEEWIANVGKEYSERYRFMSRNSNPTGPYLPLLVTYIRANNRIENHEPHQAFLYSACSTALFTADYLNTDEGQKFCTAGWELLAILDGCPSDDLSKEQDWPERPDYAKVRRSLETIAGRYLGDDAVSRALHSIIQNYGLKTIDAISDHELNYNSNGGYLYFQQFLPNPPAIFFSDGGLQVNDRELYDFCITQVFMRDAYSQLAEGNGFSCPVRSGANTSIFGEHNYPSGETCTQAIATDTCGFWDAAQKYNGPICLWTSYIGQLTKMIAASDRWEFREEHNEEQ